jgi:hypothetical protein
VAVVIYSFQKPEKKEVFQGQGIILSGYNFYQGEDSLVKNPTVVVEVDTGNYHFIRVRVTDPCAIKGLLYSKFFYSEKDLKIGNPGDIYQNAEGEWIYAGQLIGPLN